MKNILMNTLVTFFFLTNQKLERNNNNIALGQKKKDVFLYSN